MLKKTITYTNYNGEEITEEFYFNLNKAELMEWVTRDEHLGEKINEMVETENKYGMFSFVKELVLKAYGVKTEDGRRFMKSEQLSRDFEQSEAYSELMFQLATDADASQAFIDALIPNVNVTN